MTGKPVQVLKLNQKWSNFSKVNMSRLSKNDTKVMPKTLSQIGNLSRFWSKQRAKNLSIEIPTVVNTLPSKNEF